jgi:hypothetical protein
MILPMLSAILAAKSLPLIVHLAQYATQMRRFRVSCYYANSARFSRKNAVVPQALRYGFSATSSAAYD